MISLTLPWPPSGNTQTRNVRGRSLTNDKHKMYYLTVKSLVASARAKGELPKKPVEGDCHVRVVYHPPDRRKRDAGNMEKTLYDALTKAGVWKDDVQGNNQDRRWREPVKPGRVELQISPMEGLEQ